MKKLLFVLLILTSSMYSKDILISFDGSAKLAMWKDTLQFAKANNVKFTYFVSGPYFISQSQEKLHPYWAEQEIGKPYVNFRPDSAQYGTNERWNYMIEASKEGHEIGSHLCGHYDGSKWTYEKWMKEFNYFKWCMSIDKNFDNSIIKSVRAPYLATNQDYFRALKDSGFLYDSSLVYSKHNQYTNFEVPIREIIVKDGTEHLTLPFDCNFILYKVPIGMTSQQIFFDSLCWDYLNNPLPTQICLHFEQMNDGAYYNAMKEFVIWVKDKNPHYMTYSEYANGK